MMQEQPPPIPRLSRATEIRAAEAEELTLFLNTSILQKVRVLLAHVLVRRHSLHFNKLHRKSLLEDLIRRSKDGIERARARAQDYEGCVQLNTEYVNPFKMHLSWRFHLSLRVASVARGRGRGGRGPSPSFRSPVGDESA